MKKNYWYVLILGLLYLIVGFAPDSRKEEPAADVKPAAATEYTIGDRKKVALTFDDGPGNYTKELLDGLKERNVKATFFVLGEKAQQNPDIIRQMKEDGHCIGNHTYHHVDLSSLSEEQALEEIQQTNQVLAELTGESPIFLRPPFGACSNRLKESLQMMVVLWDVDPLDWTTSNTTEVVQCVVSDVSNDSVILLHDIYESSVDAALQIVDILQEQGYEFVTIEEIVFP